ncbi:MAG: CD225/dispanin family protein [Tannerella sp.]|jgi:hypothetical protein|nr:CD225/dispanin family protein [Tannerella sp.]
MDNKAYYYLNGQIKMGPFSLDTLRHAPVRPDTLVWNSSLPDWVEARTLPELQPFFESTPRPAPPAPPFRQNTPPASSQQPANAYSPHPSFDQQTVRPPLPDNYLVWAVLTTVLCCLPMGIASIVYSSNVNTAYYAGDYEGAQRASAKARQWAMWSALTALIFAALYFIGIFIFAFIGALS